MSDEDPFVRCRVFGGPWDGRTIAVRGKTGRVTHLHGTHLGEERHTYRRGPDGHFHYEGIDAGPPLVEDWRGAVADAIEETAHRPPEEAR